MRDGGPQSLFLGPVEVEGQSSEGGVGEREHGEASMLV